MKLVKKAFATLLNNKEGEMQSYRYYILPFSLTANSAELKICVKQLATKDYVQLPVALFYKDEARILKASDGQEGDYTYTYIVGEEENTPGSTKGTLLEGDYSFIIYKRRMKEESIEVEITIETEDSTRFVPQTKTTFDTIVKNPKPGWYKGELHIHSSQSTGRVDIKTILEFATDHHYDFLAITDHFTASHWEEIERQITENSPLCLKSVEISGDKGHMNAHGLTSWINPLVDDNEALPFKEKPSMTKIAEQVHKMGGIVTINHALSGLVCWRYPDFDFKDADALEVWCTADYQTTFLYPTFWDQYLKQGLHLTGTGSSDSHHPTAIEGWKMGNILTHVKAENLSQKGIIEGIKKGCCYISIGGSEMEFTATFNDQVYDMGDTLPHNSTPVFKVVLKHHPSGHLMIYRDGLQEDAIYFNSGEIDEYTFTLPHFKYCRLEFHEDIVKTRFWGMVYRDHNSMRLLSNPIYCD